ncbi:MAG: hypothetical protein WCQ66_05445, partial [Sphaerochaetaceae bacterium]
KSKADCGRCIRRYRRNKPPPRPSNPQLIVRVLDRTNGFRNGGEITDVRARTAEQATAEAYNAAMDL